MKHNWWNDIPHWPGSLPQIEVKGSKSALILIDMQNYFISKNGSFRKLVENQFPKMEAYFTDRMTNLVIPKVNELVEFFRKNNSKIIYVRTGPLLPDGSDQFARRYERDKVRAQHLDEEERLIKGSIQHEIIDELMPINRIELVIDKNSSSAFNSTAIDQYLRNFGIEFTVIAGIFTNNCVESTARDAADRGYNVVIAEDACAALDEESHIATLKTFARSYGKVSQTENIIDITNQSLTKKENINWS